MRECSICSETKPLDAFYKQKGCRDGRRPYCKECDKARARARQAAKSEAIREYDRGRYTGERAEAMRKRARDHYEANRETHLAQKRAYYEANRETWHVYRASRKARLKGVEHEPYTRREIYDRDNGICAECKKELPFEPHGFHIDHIVPLFHGGPDTPANVQVMCPRCNRRKWANLPE